MPHAFIKSSHALMLEIWRRQNLWDLIRLSLTGSLKPYCSAVYSIDDGFILV